MIYMECATETFTVKLPISKGHADIPNAIIECNTTQGGAKILTALATHGRRWIAMGDNRATAGLDKVVQANGHNNPLHLFCNPTRSWAGKLATVSNWSLQATQRAEMKIGGIYWLTAPYKEDAN